MISAGQWAPSDPEWLVYKSKDCSANLPLLDCEPSMPVAMIIMDSTALASSFKGTMEKALKCPNRTIGKTLMYLEEMLG